LPKQPLKAVFAICGIDRIKCALDTGHV
jgi:hypothetical protein